MVVDKKSGAVIGRLVEGKARKLAGKKVGEHGEIVNEKGKVVGRVDPIEQDSSSEEDDSSKEEDESAAANQEDKESAAATNEEDETFEAPIDDKKEGVPDDKEQDTPADDKKDEQQPIEGETTDVEKQVEDLDVGREQAEDAAIAGTSATVSAAAGGATGEVSEAAEDAKDDAEDATDAEDKPFNPNEMVNEDSPEVKKSGKVLDMDDNIVGHVDKRMASKLAGFKVDEDGNVIDHDGHIVGVADMIKPVEEKKPFNPNEMFDEDSPEVKKSGKVVDMEDNVVGSVDKPMAPKLVGFKVDPDGNVINHEGHIVARAEMIKEEETEDDKPFNPNTMVDEHSPEVRRSGKVVDEDDNIVGTVDKSAAHKLAGFKVDHDGNIINHEGHIVGKAEMIKQMTEEERKQEAEDNEYRRIADLMSQAIQQSLDKIKPVLKMITENIEAEEAKPEKDRDEKKLVETVKPLIEQGSNILGEANGAIRGLDPSGKIAKTAQARTSERKALPEEYHLADLLSQLAGVVSTTIDNAKKKIKNMPHAKKELSPLWNILQSPLLQNLSAVGLLLTGVLGLVGNILNGLGLGSIINSLLGGIGLNKILEDFGLGDALKLGSRK